MRLHFTQEYLDSFGDCDYGTSLENNPIVKKLSEVLNVRKPSVPMYSRVYMGTYIIGVEGRHSKQWMACAISPKVQRFLMCYVQSGTFYVKEDGTVETDFNFPFKYVSGVSSVEDLISIYDCPGSLQQIKNG